MPPKLLIVSAARGTAEAFEKSELARSLGRLRSIPEISRLILLHNSKPLAHFYNHAIDKADADDWLLFVHDDVAIDDFHLYQRLGEAFQRFEVIGVAGNTEAGPNQVAWYYHIAPDTGELVPTLHGSGAVYHSDEKLRILSYYGPTPQSCQILDGCFLATKASALKERGIRFDPQFAFHFYDVDFCRQCIQAGLRLGTWPIAISHASAGNFISPEWKATLPKYQAKWSADPWPARLADPL